MAADTQSKKMGWKMTSAREKRKLADALADAGVGSRRVAIELLYLLPESFVAAYESLFHEALSLGDEGKGRQNDEQAALGRAASGGSGKGSGGGSRKNSVFPIKNDEAFAKKEWVDRQLRKLTRAMNGGVGLNEQEERFKCGQRTEKARAEKKGCGKWQEKNWIYCPFCGWQNKMKIVNVPEGGMTVQMHVVSEAPPQVVPVRMPCRRHRRMNCRDCML